MYVILTAFQGKLKSEPMLWPEQTPPTIDLIMDLDYTIQPYYKVDTLGLAAQDRGNVGRFEKTDYHFVVKIADKQETAREYRLIGLR